MKKRTATLIWLCIFLAFVNLVWLGYNSFMYLGIPKVFTKPDIYLNLIGIGILVSLVSHLIIITSTILSLKNSRSLSIAGSILLVLGVISIIALLLYFLAYDQLYEAYEYNDPYESMLKLAWTSESIIISFFLYSLIYFFTLSRKGYSYVTTNSVFRERVFVALNAIGIVCSVVGMLFVWFDFQLLDNMDCNINSAQPIRRIDIFPFCLILLPYLFVLAGWGISCFKDRKSGWVDEKQNSDINRSGMIALLVSLPLVIGLIINCFLKAPLVSKPFYIAGTIPVLWLLLYLFVVLFAFSITALYSFKKN